MKTLITGATGNIGSRVVDLLIASGERPRVFVRNAEKARARFGDRVEVVVGDLAEGTSLAAALMGMESLLLITAEGPDLPRRDAEAARAAKFEGVQHLVKLSAYSAALPNGGGSALGQWHAAGEAAIESSGLPWTFVQPSGFMSNALNWGPAIKGAGVVRASAGEGKIAMIHPDDIAEVVFQTLTKGQYAHERLVITGPVALSYGEMLSKIEATVGKPIRFEAIADDQALAQLLRNGMPQPLAEALIALWRSVREGKVERVTDTVQRITGRAPKTFESWASENRAAFL